VKNQQEMDTSRHPYKVNQITRFFLRTFGAAEMVHQIAQPHHLLATTMLPWKAISFWLHDLGDPCHP
jgi:hypothetical protein